MKDFEKEVSRGIAFLDEHCPDWKNKIDLDTLDMKNCSYCVLGQVFGDWFKGKRCLEIEDQVSVDLGFDISYSYPYNYDWRRLTSAWIKALETGDRK